MFITNFIKKLFKRKRRNRQKPRSNVLDVKLSSDNIRAGRMRLGAAAMGLVFATIFGLYLFWMSGSMLLNHFVYQNSAFAIEQINVETDGVLSPDQLRRWAGVKTGDNLMALDLSRVKRNLELVSLIKSVAVERVLPHILRLRVSEREPVAEARLYQAGSNGGVEATVLHIDVDGYVMTLPEPRQLADPSSKSTNALPLLLGVEVSELIPGRRISSSSVHSALNLIDAFEHSPMTGMVDLQSVQVSSSQVLQVTTTRGAVVVFTPADFDRQFRRWRDIQDMAVRQSKTVATLDLSIPNSIPATWSELGEMPQTLPIKNHPSRSTRKKHV